MNAKLKSMGLFFAAIALAATRASAAPAAIADPSTPGKATITVTAIGKKDKPVSSVYKDDLQLAVSKERKQIAGWSKGGPLTLAILIDDSLDSSAAGQWSDLKQFIMAQSPDTQVAIAYAANSTAMIAQDFTRDHALAAKALRIPRGPGGIGSSPYLAVIDWMKRWPETGGRRSLLLVSSGIDSFRGSFGPFYPDVDSAIEIAQRGNVNLWSIYYPGSERPSRSFALATLGQNNLNKMTQETGGETYFLGTTAPVSIKPYLDEIRLHLNNQYLLTFAGDGGPKGKRVKMQLKTELPAIGFSHANNAYLAPSR